VLLIIVLCVLCFAMGYGAGHRSGWAESKASDEWAAIKAGFEVDPDWSKH
jgi:hypothetical protein